MKTLKKLFSTVLALALISLPMTVYGQETSTNNIIKYLNSNLSVKKSPQKSITNPADYPLVNDGQYVDTLYDSYYSSHKITFEKTESYSTTQMKVRILDQDEYTNTKDPYLFVEFYSDNNGTLIYNGSTQFNTSGYLQSDLGSLVDKSYYTNQPYIYMRIGTAESATDLYYSDTTLFKVANPFYSGTTPPSSGNSNYVVVNNESASGSNSEYTGTFSVKNSNYTYNKQLNPEAYQMDVNKPFDPSKNKNKQIKTIFPWTVRSYVVGDSKSFWVTNFVTGNDYQISAKLLYSGTKSNVWVNNSQITQTDAAKLGSEFDNKIHPIINTNFGQESDVDGNGKVNILVYDIQDGFSGSGGYIGGYFWAGDLYNVPDSNQSEIFYMDTYPSMGLGSTKDVTAVYSTLAHEFQHMVNFNRNVFVEGGVPMDTWLNEGMSMAAEQIYTGKTLTDRIDYYNSSSSITNGHSLLYWDDTGDVLSNYSLSYLFCQYLKLQANQGDSIFKEILNDPNNNYKAVENAVKKYINSSLTFGKFTTDFRAALLLKQSSGLYGFKGTTDFANLQPKIYSGTGTYLNGGGAVVKQLNSQTTFNPPTNKGTDITYTFLSNNSVDTTPPVINSVNKVTDKDVSVTGTTETKAKVFVNKGTTLLGSASADSTGKFSVPIAKQPGGTALSVYAQDAAGNKSTAKSITVADTTPPAAPTVNPVADNQTTVAGIAEAKSIVTVKSGTTILGTGTSSSTGTFSITINQQKAGTKLIVYATDTSGNKSAEASVTVLDKTPPMKPVLNSIGDNQTIIYGQTEAGAMVTVKAGLIVLGQSTADSTGSFTVKISAAQTAGTSITIYAYDSSANSSSITTTIVDKTPPAAPTVNKVTYLSTAISGKAEIGSTIYIFNGSTLIGKTVTDLLGGFKVSIKAQKQGSTLEADAMDKAGNQSKPVLIKVY